MSSAYELSARAENSVEISEGYLQIGSSTKACKDWELVQVEAAKVPELLAAVSEFPANTGPTTHPTPVFQI